MISYSSVVKVNCRRFYGKPVYSNLFLRLMFTVTSFCVQCRSSLSFEKCLLSKQGLLSFLLFIHDWFARFSLPPRASMHSTCFTCVLFVCLWGFVGLCSSAHFEEAWNKWKMGPEDVSMSENRLCSRSAVWDWGIVDVALVLLTAEAILKSTPSHRLVVVVYAGADHIRKQAPLGGWKGCRWFV